jgi:hypothetical protein
MRYRVLLPAAGRPHLIYFSHLHSDDDQARRLVAEK